MMLQNDAYISEFTDGERVLMDDKQSEAQRIVIAEQHLLDTKQKNS